MKKTLLLLPILALLSACGSIFNDNAKDTDVVVEDRSSNNDPDAIVRETTGFEWHDSTKTTNNTIDLNTNSAEGRALAALKNTDIAFVLYFDYDDFTINDATTQEIIKHANFMRDNPTINLRLEGHADERGTREYNLALGENRAISVKEVLGLYKGLDARVQVVSYGEESPVVDGHNEFSWGKNRRVEFIYQLNN